MKNDLYEKFFVYSYEGGKLLFFYMFIVSEITFNGYSVYNLNLIFLVAILLGILVIVVKNPIISVLFLIGLFLSISGYLILTGLNFLGLSYLLVYVGAVSILFLFILMLINVRISELLTDNINSIPYAIIVGSFFGLFVNDVLPYIDISHNFLYTFFVEKTLNHVTSMSWDGYLAEISHITTIGNILYGSYAIWLIITSIILLLAMVGAIVITYKPQSINSNNNIEELDIVNYQIEDLEIVNYEVEQLEKALSNGRISSYYGELSYWILVRLLDNKYNNTHILIAMIIVSVFRIYLSDPFHCGSPRAFGEPYTPNVIADSLIAEVHNEIDPTRVWPDLERNLIARCNEVLAEREALGIKSKHITVGDMGMHFNEEGLVNGHKCPGLSSLSATNPEIFKRTGKTPVSFIFTEMRRLKYIKP